MKNRPHYALESVDNVLLVLQMLRDQGRLRVRQVADDLGIAPSTAHRLLAMLVYRDFASQDGDRCYVPGPGLTAPYTGGGSAAQQLRRALLPQMDVLGDRVGETVNLMVRVGTQTRFLATVESTQILHIGDRQGTILPAAHSSGGKALLAELTDDELAALYLGGDERAMPADQFQRLLDSLRAVRQHGYALNVEETETGVCAVGRCVYDRADRAVAAITISAPSVRFAKERIPRLVTELRRTTADCLATLP